MEFSEAVQKNVKCIANKFPNNFTQIAEGISTEITERIRRKECKVLLKIPRKPIFRTRHRSLNNGINVHGGFLLSLT